MSYGVICNRLLDAQRYLSSNLETYWDFRDGFSLRPRQLSFLLLFLWSFEILRPAEVATSSPPAKGRKLRPRQVDKFYISRGQYTIPSTCCVWYCVLAPRKTKFIRWGEVVLWLDAPACKKIFCPIERDEELWRALIEHRYWKCEPRGMVPDLFHVQLCDRNEVTSWSFTSIRVLFISYWSTDMVCTSSIYSRLMSHVSMASGYLTSFSVLISS